MGLLSEVVDWFSDGSNWKGSDGIVQQLGVHVQISFVAVVAACLIALPAAVWLGHQRRFGVVAVNVSNVGRAIPSFALIILGTNQFGLETVPGIGSLTTFIALVALAVPPMVTNAYVAVAEVPEELRDAARGMGMTEARILREVELPVAAPLIMAGIRTAAVQVVATATIAAFVGADGLGTYIIHGRAINDQAEVIAGAILVAALSLCTEGLLALLQYAVTPRALREADVPTGAEAMALAVVAEAPEGRGTPA